MIFRNAMVWTQKGLVEQNAILDGGVLSFSNSQIASVAAPEMPVFSSKVKRWQISAAYIF